jgi:GNAT superfamily N-acetyltransferase
MQPLVRKATVMDSLELARVQVESYRSAYAELLPADYLAQFSIEEQSEDWRMLLAAAGRTDRQPVFVAARSDNTLVGYALGEVHIGNACGYDCELVALHVSPEAQGLGIGLRLIAALTTTLRKAGCQSLILWTLAGNPVQALYKRLGGIQVGQKPWSGNDYYGLSVSEVAYGWPDIALLHHHAVAMQQ